MKKQKIINYLSIIIYGTLLSLGLLLVLVGAISYASVPKNGGNLADGISAVIFILLIIIGAIQSFVALVPFILKIIFVKKKKIGLPIVSLLFDVAFAVFYFSVLLGSLSDGGEITTFVVSLIIVLISLISFIFNVMAIRFCKKSVEI